MKLVIDSQMQCLFGGNQKGGKLSLETGETKHFAVLACVTDCSPGIIRNLLQVILFPFLLIETVSSIFSLLVYVR